jgi:pyrroloquinoline quinone biosynthesis protein E
MTAPETLASPRPFTLVAELTYKCPLRCVYCSNPVQYAHADQELNTETWQRVFVEAEQLGVVQVHLTGGEPLLRNDLGALIGSAHAAGLYTSLITSAVTLTRERLRELARRGLDHVQVSIQGLTDAGATRIAGRSRLQEKLSSMAWVREFGLPLTLNVVLHRENIDEVPQLVELALKVGAERLELANTQYLGWALENRTALLPSRAQIDRARVHATAAAERLKGTLEVLFVLPDYQADVVRPCMQGWAQRYIVISPDGLVLPCHQAHTLPGLQWERAGQRPLREIWTSSPGLNAFRGEQWMPEPCRSCDQRTVDFGGCRCQAFHLTGRIDATDPACVLAPDHHLVLDARTAAENPPEKLIELKYRHPPRAAS